MKATIIVDFYPGMASARDELAGAARRAGAEIVDLYFEEGGSWHHAIYEKGLVTENRCPEPLKVVEIHAGAGGDPSGVWDRITGIRVSGGGGGTGL